eukprot:UN05310
MNQSKTQKTINPLRRPLVPPKSQKKSIIPTHSNIPNQLAIKKTQNKMPMKFNSRPIIKNRSFNNHNQGMKNNVIKSTNFLHNKLGVQKKTLVVNRKSQLVRSKPKLNPFNR